MLKIFVIPSHQNFLDPPLAEATVKCVKYMLRKTAPKNTDQDPALLEMRNTPRQNVNCSPAELGFGHTVRSIMPAQTKPSGILNTTKKQQRKSAIKKHYDQHAKPLPELKPGDVVFFQSPHKEGWEQGVVTKQLRSQTYIVRNRQGTTYIVRIRQGAIDSTYRNQGIIRGLIFTTRHPGFHH